MPSVLFVTDRGGAQEHARCRLPAQALARHGWRTAHTSSLMRPARRDPRIWHHDLGSPSVVVLRMVADPRVPELVRVARAAGQVFIADIDDLLWDIPEWSEVHAYAGRAEQVARLEEVMAACDLVTCSTPALAAEVGRHIATPAVVVRNGVDVAAFRPHIKDREPLRLAVPGLLAFRSGDLASIGDALADAVRGQEVELWHLGAHPDSPDIADVLPGVECPIVRRPWARIGDLPRVYEQVDLAVTPLAPHPFNEARSTFTGLGLAAAGLPFIASATGEYRRLWMQGIGVVAASPTEWGTLLGGLLTSQGARDEMNVRGRREVARLYGLDAMAGWWAEAFDAARKVVA